MILFLTKKIIMCIMECYYVHHGVSPLALPIICWNKSICAWQYWTKVLLCRIVGLGYDEYTVNLPILQKNFLQALFSDYSVTFAKWTVRWSHSALALLSTEIHTGFLTWNHNQLILAVRNNINDTQTSRKPAQCILNCNVLYRFWI